MIDIKLLRTDLKGVAEKLKKRNFILDVDKFSALESKRKELQIQSEELKARRNANAKNVGVAKAKREDVSSLMEEGVTLNEALEVIEESLDKVQKEIDEILWSIPNILHKSVPVGLDDSENVEVRKFKEPTKFDFEPKDHTDLGEKLGCMDFEAAAKISGSRFVVLYGHIARLQRALIQFMLDVHTQEHGYKEVYVPYLVNRESMFGAGKLPKFEDDHFFTEGHPSFSLIPTAEVPLTNLVRDSILDSDKLPMKFVSHSANFRKESGSYGRDVRGMLRQHQFEKVELVQIVRPEDSYNALEDMTRHAETILQKLELPYRVMLLCSGDTGFCAAKTYDLEVWLPGQNQYREISSCSNCEDFQARRMQARFKNPTTNKTEFVHMLNGSGVAVGRALIAVIENYQNKDGRIHIPRVLQPYMDDITFIG